MTEDMTDRPIRLLIADDEEDLVTFLAHRLRKRGLEVTVAVVDLKMPDMDGITVIEQLQLQQPNIEVVMLTGHGSHDSAWEAGRLHAFRYLLKPCEFEDLHDIVLTAARHRRRRMKEEFEAKLSELMSDTTSPRELIEESEKLRSEYEQD